MKTLPILAAASLFASSPGSHADAINNAAQIQQDLANKTVVMSDAAGNLRICLNYAGHCYLDQVQVHGKQVVAAKTGVCTGIQMRGSWVTTRDPVGNPKITIAGNDVTAAPIEYSLGGVSVRESWRFHVGEKDISWKITREYLSGGVVDDSYFPGWDFSEMSTWTAGLLDTGGVAWCRYLDNTSSFGTHAGSVRFWKDHDCLTVTTMSPGGASLASRFSHQPSGIFTFVQSVTPQPLATKHLLHRSIQGLDVWAPFQIIPGTLQTTITLAAADADAVRSRGEFKGIDGHAIGDVLDTIGRYGVIDRQLMGGNGWLTGYICLHEPFFAEMGLAIDDPDYTANLATSLDGWRDHALKPDGRVISRWHHDTSDNMVPGTYDPATGYYECGWGYLLDSQVDYPINVSEQFDLSGDMAWLRGQKEPCERALDWLLKRDADGDGLVEMMNDSHTQKKSSDWIDVVWAAGENALVNAELYYALVLWSEREEILGDMPKADRYRAAAKHLKESFVKPVSQGGFWNPDKGWFTYWRDKDGSIHGDNLVTPVNFCAVAYGLCDDSQRKAILDGIEARMIQEKLFHWPLCFLPYAADEGGREKFPGYENGDIFLSWGEVAVRAYAQYKPEIAVAYVGRVLDRYRQDGLSYQRYLRADQSGAGDDILAGNSMTVVGLYRDIYGIRPQWDRLMLDPHLTPALEGTRLSYTLRNDLYHLTLHAAACTGVVMNFTVTAPGPFAFRASPEKVTWFAGTADRPSLEIAREKSAKVEIKIMEWPATPQGARRWMEISPDTATTHTVNGLVANASYRLKIENISFTTLFADSKGSVTFSHAGDPANPQAFALEPVSG